MFRIGLLVLLLQVSSHIFAAEPFTAKVHYAGLLDVEKQTLRIDSLKKTRKIPAVLGQVFGIYYEVSGGAVEKGILVKEVVRNHGGEEITRHRIVTDAGNVLAFSFDEPEELVEGSWTFEVWLGNEQVMEQIFDVSTSHPVYKGGSDGFLASFCDTEIKTGSNLPVKTCAPKLASP